MKTRRSLLLKALSFAGSKLRRTPLARLRVLNRAFAALSVWLHGSNEAAVGPFRVRLDPRDRVIAKKLILYGEWERHGISLLCSLLKPGDHVLDIGANIGLYSLYLSRAVGPTGRVVAVEPDPGNLVLLRSNIEVNACKNVDVLPCALGAHAGVVDLFQSGWNRGRLSLADVSGEGWSLRVPMRRGEEVFAKLQIRPVAAKIDVEGAEPLVLSGLGRYQPNVLFFEFAPQAIRAFGNDPRTFLDSLVNDGYRLEFVDPDSGSRLPSTPAEIMNLVAPGITDYNILAIR